MHPSHAGGPALVRPSVAPEPSRPAAGEAPIVTAYRRRAHEVHRLAELLHDLVHDPRVTGPADLPAELRHEIADAVEILVEVCDLLPT